jgi:RNA polymerase sigma-70 factor (ECF subfamily)
MSDETSGGRFSSARDHGSQSSATGDVERFRALYVRHYSQVVRFFRVRGFAGDASRDLAQETFARVFRGIRAFRGESRFETWLFKIAINVYLNELRSRKVKRSTQEMSLELAVPGEGVLPSAASEDESNESVLVTDPALVDRESGALETVLAAERMRMLGEALNDLPPQMRQCVLLRLQDLKYEEIAVAMRISIQTVRSQLHEARVRLRSALSHYFNDVGNEDLWGA